MNFVFLFCMGSILSNIAPQKGQSQIFFVFIWWYQNLSYICPMFHKKLKKMLEQVTIEQTGKILKSAIIEGGYTHKINELDCQYIIGMYGARLNKFTPLETIQRTINGLVYHSKLDNLARTFGLWFEGEHLYIDICTTAYLPAEAINLGRKFNQRAIYNKTFRKVEYIETIIGGTKTR